MKIFFLFFVLSSAFVTGCSTSYNYPSTKITVYKNDTLKQDYGLLSVRGDSAIVVLAWDERNVSPTPFSHAEVIKKTSYYPLIYRAGEGGGIVNSSIGFLGGGAIGGLIGIALTPKPQPTNNPLVAFIEVANSSIFAYMFVGCLVGAVAGVLILNAVPIFSPSKYLSLRFAKDREFLRSISAYPDKEPKEMQYIK